METASGSVSRQPRSALDLLLKTSAFRVSLRRWLPILLSAEVEPSLDCILSRGREKWPFVVTRVSALLTTRLRPVVLTINVDS